MSVMTAQPRQPAGTPVGGQWTGGMHLSPDVVLLDEPAADDPDLADAAEDEPQLPTYDIKASSVDDAKKRIARANARLERAGIADRFHAEYEPYTRIAKNPQTGVMEQFDRCRVTLNRPSISYDGFTFAARIETTESGQIMAMSAPDVELDGWRPESLVCEHCGTTRQRKNLFAVRDEDGTMKVIGSSCLHNYTGIKPEGLWTLEWDELADMAGDDDWDAGGWGNGIPTAPARDVLAVAAGAAAVQGGYHGKYSDQPTSALVRNILFPPAKLTPEDRDLHDRVWVEARKVDTAALADEIREALGDGGSDWADNVTTLLSEEWVNYKHTALLASSISAVERMRAKKREKATIAPGFVAPVGEKITGTKATVLKLRRNTAYFGYQERTTEMVRLQTEDGHIITWWASSPTGLDEGAAVTIDRATVKEHEQYNGEDQTVVTRAKLTPVDEPAATT